MSRRYGTKACTISFAGAAMKSLTLQLADEIYERALRKAAQRGATLNGEVTELIRSYGDKESDGAASNGAPPSADAGPLLAALNAGRNIVPVGRLGRDDLYDRPVLH